MTASSIPNDTGNASYAKPSVTIHAYFRTIREVWASAHEVFRA